MRQLIASCLSYAYYGRPLDETSDKAQLIRAYIYMDRKEKCKTFEYIHLTISRIIIRPTIASSP